MANPSLSVASTRDLLELKHTLEEREKAAFAASVAPAGGPRVKVAMEMSQPQKPPPIPQKPQHQQHPVAAEQIIWPVSVNRERPRSLLLIQDRNGRSDAVDQVNHDLYSIFAFHIADRFRLPCLLGIYLIVAFATIRESVN